MKPSRFSILSHLWEFVKAEKKWVLAPLLLLFILLGVLVVFAQGSALAPFIYTIF